MIYFVNRKNETNNLGKKSRKETLQELKTFEQYKKTKKKQKQKKVLVAILHSKFHISSSIINNLGSLTLAEENYD